MDSIQKRHLEALEYSTPEELLRITAPVITDILQNSEAAAHLSKQEKKDYRESYQAAFLGYVVKQMARQLATVSVATRIGRNRILLKENEDFDCVIKGVLKSSPTYRKVQLKELSGHPKNLKSQTQSIVEYIKRKYPVSCDLIVAVWINRALKFDLASINLVGLKISQLWFFAHAESAEMIIVGGLVSDLLRNACFYGQVKNGVPRIRRRKFGDS